MEAVDVSVIVVTFNNAPLVGRCLRAVKQSVSEYVAEILIVDNASTDDTVRCARDAAPEADVIKLDRNVGFAAANNVGFQSARGRYVALVNSDAFPDPGSIDRLVQRAEDEASIGLVGGRLRYPSGRQQPSTGRFPSLLGNLAVALFLHRLPLVSWLHSVSLQIPSTTVKPGESIGSAAHSAWLDVRLGHCQRPVLCMARMSNGPGRQGKPDSRLGSSRRPRQFICSPAAQPQLARRGCARPGGRSLT